MAAHLGVDVVKEGAAFNRAEIEHHHREAGRRSAGDVVIFHTGWLSLIEKDPKRFVGVLGRDGARYRCRRASSP